MEWLDNRLCISHAELTAGIMSESYLKQLRRRGKVRQERRACYGVPALFAVESLPCKYRTEVYRRYPDLREQAESRPFMETIVPDGQAMRFYAEYTFPDGRHLTTEKQREYSNNCAIMNAFRQCMEISNSHRMRQSKPRLNKTEFWRKAAAALPRLADRFPHSLPESERRLQSKFNEYVREGFPCFISGKFRNSNAAKVDDDVKESVLVSILAHHNNFDNAAVAEMYNAVAEREGWKRVTARTVCEWRERTDLLTSVGRLGTSNFRNTKSMQVRRSRPTAPFLMWTLDGWDVELLYQSSKTDGKGRTVTTYSNRLTLEVVLDPCVNYPIGYAIGTHETQELIAEALRNAARHSGELFGQMLRANQIQCDHYAIKAMTPLYNVMGDKLTPARARNAKTKAVEPYFNHLNRTYCRYFNNWSGFSVTTDPKRQPNSEALNALRTRFPDEEGVRRQIEGIIAEERRRKEGQFREMMGNLPDSRRLPLSREQYLLAFGAETGHRNAIAGNGLTATLLGARREYDCFDAGFRLHSDVRWTLRYDPDDPHEVLAVSEDGTLRYMLTEKHVQPMALADRRDGDAAELQRIRDFNAALEGAVAGRLNAAHAKAEPVIMRDSTLSRLLICDSEGQHKLPKARMRLEAAVPDSDTVDIPVLPQGSPVSDIDDFSIF